jgi:hypothetical protein
VPFSGGRKPTLRSVRIVRMQDSNAATTATGAGTGHEDSSFFSPSDTSGELKAKTDSDRFLIALWWFPRFSCLSQFMRAKPLGCTQ